jgi:hypothetical protein
MSHVKKRYHFVQVIFEVIGYRDTAMPIINPEEVAGYLIIVHRKFVVQHYSQSVFIVGPNDSVVRSCRVGIYVALTIILKLPFLTVLFLVSRGSSFIGPWPGKITKGGLITTFMLCCIKCWVSFAFFSWLEDCFSSTVILAIPTTDLLVCNGVREARLDLLLLLGSLSTLPSFPTSAF